MVKVSGMLAKNIPFIGRIEKQIVILDQVIKVKKDQFLKVNIENVGVSMPEIENSGGRH